MLQYLPDYGNVCGRLASRGNAKIQVFQLYCTLYVTHVFTTCVRLGRFVETDAFEFLTLIKKASYTYQDLNS